MGFCFDFDSSSDSYYHSCYVRYCHYQSKSDCPHCENVSGE